MSTWTLLKPFLAGSRLRRCRWRIPVVQLPDALMKIVLGAFILFITWGKDSRHEIG